MYIDDIIGDGGKKIYKQWENGDIVLLQAQTGMGKTYFILNTLLDYVIRNGGYIFYFVNRKLLKKQIEEDIFKFNSDILKYQEINLNDYISVKTYQSMENKGKYENLNYKVFEMQEKFKKQIPYYYCSKVFFIYDECHYFYCDSNFNPKTEMSYYYLRKIIKNIYNNQTVEDGEWNHNYVTYEKVYEKKCDYIEIFISATMDNIKNKIKYNNKYEKDLYPINGNIFNFTRDSKIYEYGPDCFKPDYSYINLKILDNENRIPDLIINSSEKWLIFVDNKNYGKNLFDILKDKGIDVSYIDADYNNDNDAKKTINQITENSLTEKMVIISTSVIDNGVSIKDENLRNLIILVDNKETFMQMVGRIRIKNNTDKINLYICKKTKQDFKKRLRLLKKLYEFYKRYENDMVTNITIHPLEANNNYLEYNKLIKKQSKLLNDILSNPETINYARKLCYSVDGFLVISSFSVQRCVQLITFYTDIIEKFDLQGENAFVYTVGEWLGKEFSEVGEIVDREKEALRNKSIKNIDEFLSKKLSAENNILMSKAENINIRKNLLDDFKFVLNNRRGNVACTCEGILEINKILKNLDKNERPISDKSFNIIMKLIHLPYKLTTKRKRGYLLEKI